MFGIVDNTINLSKPKYNKTCLGNTVLKLARKNYFKHVPNSIPKMIKNNLTCNYHSLYLDRLNEERKYFLKMIKYSDSKSGSPFSSSEKKMQNNMSCVIIASDIAKVSIVT